MTTRHDSAETWRERRLREKHARLRATGNTGDGCICDTGPIIVATWRGDILTVALEHRHYCPTPSTPYNPDLYATTGQRIPIH